MHYLGLAKNNTSAALIYRCLLISALPACLFYLISLAVLSTYGLEIMEILRDPAQQSGQSSFLCQTKVQISALVNCFFCLDCSRLFWL